MSTATDAPAARRLMDSAVVGDAIERIVAELRSAQSALDGARPPSPGLAASYEQTLAQLGTLKGRPPLYPYVGSGLGHGPLVELADGSVKWDMISGIGVHAFGHSDPDLVATALRAAMGDTVMQGNLQCNEDVVAFGSLLVDEVSHHSRLHHCFLTGSGAMANESALKICMQHRDGKAPRILAFADCFMGRSTTMAQIGDSAAGRVGLPLNVLVDYLPFYDPQLGERSIHHAVDHLRDCLDRYPDQHACFVMELVQGEGGFKVAPREFFEPLVHVCRERGVPVWADEVQTFGRTPSMFYHDELGLGELVDVVTIGKLSQVCACLYNDELNPKPGLLSGTFVGSTVGLQVGRRILERLRDGGYYRDGDDAGRIARLHDAFRERANALVERHPDCFGPIPAGMGGRRESRDFVGGVGGMMRFTPFGGDRVKIVKLLHLLFERGVIAFYCGHGPYHLRFLPPIGVMEPAQFDEVFSIIDAAIGDLD